MSEWSNTDLEPPPRYRADGFRVIDTQTGDVVWDWSLMLGWHSEPMVEYITAKDAAERSASDAWREP